MSHPRGTLGIIAPELRPPVSYAAVIDVTGAPPPGVCETTPTGPPKPRLLDRVRLALRARHGSRRTEKTYVAWIRRYILFHGTRHPAEMGATEVRQFLSALAVERNVAVSTQNQALSALLFLSRNVLEQELPWLDEVVRAKRAARLPVVLTREEVRAVLREIHGPPRLMAILLYGAGLRVLECARLRVKDVDFATNELVVRAGKGHRDRVTMLPGTVKADLAQHLELVRGQHARDLQPGGAALGARAEVPRRMRRLLVCVPILAALAWLVHVAAAQESARWLESFETYKANIRELDQARRTDCEKQLYDILKSIDDHRSCNNHSECTLVGEEPFGPLVPVRQDFSAALLARTKAFRESCNDESVQRYYNTELRHDPVCWKGVCMVKSQRK